MRTNSATLQLQEIQGRIAARTHKCPTCGYALKVWHDGGAVGARRLVRVCGASCGQVALPAPDLDALVAGVAEVGK